MAAITSTLVGALFTSGLCCQGQSWRHADGAAAGELEEGPCGDAHNSLPHLPLPSSALLMLKEPFGTISA